MAAAGRRRQLPVRWGPPRSSDSVGGPYFKLRLQRGGRPGSATERASPRCTWRTNRRPLSSRSLTPERSIVAFARGTFNLKMVPRGTVDEGEGSPFGWVSVDKGFRGDPEGASRGEMLTALTDVEGSAGYLAVERVRGKRHTLAGCFALEPCEVMTRCTPPLTITVVPDFRTAEIPGRRAITIVEGAHSYEFDYRLPDVARPELPAPGVLRFAVAGPTREAAGSVPAGRTRERRPGRPCPTAPS